MARKNLSVFVSKHDRELAKASVPDFLAAEEGERAEELDAQIATLKSSADVKRWQRKVRRGLDGILGPFPKRTPLHARVVGKIELDGLTIERVIFESQPKYYVTANVYIPKNYPTPAPAVLVPCGHTVQGKASSGYHSAGMGLALKGYVAMVYDPTGQGERSECINRKTGREFVHREVPQHHYTGKPTFFTGMSLAGYRTWDGVRCLDYLCARKEVDADRLGVMGNSGGGAMTMLISCVDERVKACAASHPGGSMENSQLNGRRPPDRLLFSLLAPRPCRIIVGDQSGETRHYDKLAILKPFYKARGCADRVELVWVAGKHDLQLPKRLASYEWLNRWLGGPDPTPDEPPFKVISERRLNCTKTGQVQTSLGGETMQTLNAARAKKLAPKRSVPKSAAALKKQLSALRRAVKKRIGYQPSGGPLNLASSWVSNVPGGTVEGLVFESEPGVVVPALLMMPGDARPDAPVVLHTGDAGKPADLGNAALPLRLMKHGHPVLSVDVRDTGETSVGPILNDDSWPPNTRNWRNFNGRRWGHDMLSVRALGLGRTMLGMRTLDVIRSADLIKEDDDLAARPLVVVGEGDAGVWAMTAAALDSRIDAVVTVRTLASYRMLTDNVEYNQFGHFWLPGALLDYDLPDLLALIAPRPVLVIDPVDQMSKRLSRPAGMKVLKLARSVYHRLGAAGGLALERTAGPVASVARRIANRLQPGN
jgi:cephalosporin-C deacetylase-like acetyl esterase